MKIAARRPLAIVEHASAVARAAGESKFGGECRAALRRLIDAGMFMRGWKVSDATREPPHPYPLASRDTIVRAGVCQSKIDVNVTLAIDAYDAALAAIPDEAVREMLAGAPLVSTTVVGAKRVFVPTTNPTQQGHTVRDRLAIVREGDASESEFSCLRMTSNLVVATGVYLLTRGFGEDAPFDIDGLDEIM